MTGSIRAQIEDAFRGVPGLPAANIVLQEYGQHPDAQEMADAFGGRHWTELSLQELFHHRESIFALSPAGRLSYLPAYLRGCLADDTALVPDISWYLVGGLRTPRLELFDAEQLSVVGQVLHYVAEVFDDERAAKIQFGLAGNSRP